MKKIYNKILVLLTVTVLVLSVVSAEALSKDNKVKEPLDKITFIHYKDGTVKEIGANKAIASGGKCYKLLGVKWSSLPVDYVINPADSEMSEIDVVSAISAATNSWDEETSRSLFGSSLLDTSAVWGAADGKNAYVFGFYDNANVIAVTNIWYMTYSRQIVDYDVLFNTQFTWGNAAINPLVMDLQNIATHETGHGLGLADIYQNGCSAVTMFGYSGYGDIIKSSLEQPDINGLRKIYGI